MIKLGETRIELFEFDSPTPDPASSRHPASFGVHDHGITHLCLRVTGIEDEYARLLEAGVDFNSPPLDVGSSVCAYGRDPFGNVLEFRELKA